MLRRRLSCAGPFHLPCLGLFSLTAAPLRSSPPPVGSGSAACFYSELNTVGLSIRGPPARGCLREKPFGCADTAAPAGTVTIHSGAEINFVPAGKNTLRTTRVSDGSIVLFWVTSMSNSKADTTRLPAACGSGDSRKGFQRSTQRPCWGSANRHNSPDGGI